MLTPGKWYNVRSGPCKDRKVMILGDKHTSFIGEYLQLCEHADMMPVLIEPEFGITQIDKGTELVDADRPLMVSDLRVGDEIIDPHPDTRYIEGTVTGMKDGWLIVTWKHNNGDDPLIQELTVEDELSPWRLK